MQKFIRALNTWELLLLFFLLPLFMFPGGYRSLALFVIPALWVIRKLVTGHFIQSTPYNVAIFLMLGMVGLSFLVTFDLSLSIPKIAGILVGIALFYATIDFSRERSSWAIVVVYIAIGVLMALIGLVGAIWLPPFDFLNHASRLLILFPSGIPGTVGGIINANELAGVLSWMAPLTLALMIGIGHRLWRENKVALGLLLFATILVIFLLFATSSRGGILAFGISAVLVVAFFVQPRWRLVLVIGSIIALSVLVSFSSNIANRDIVGDTLGLSGRLEIWSRAILAIADHPITGVGINGFRQIIHVLYPLFSISPDIDLAHAHNHLLQVALDLGLPGLVSYLALWIISAGLLWSTWRNLVNRNAQHHPYYALVAGLSGSLLAGWIFGIFDTVALGSRPAFLWWLLLGLTASVHYAVVYSGEKLRRRHRRLTSTDYESRIGANPINLLAIPSDHPIEPNSSLLACSVGPSYNDSE